MHFLNGLLNTPYRGRGETCATLGELPRMDRRFVRRRQPINLQSATIELSYRSTDIRDILRTPTLRITAKMKRYAQILLLITTSFFLALLVLAVEVRADEETKSNGKAEKTEPAEKTLKLGEPLVEKVEMLKRLDPVAPVWIDPAGKRAVMLGQVCLTEGVLEMFACLANTKEHESVVSVPTKAFLVHAALLAIGAKQGRPVEFDPKYVPASGSEIEITLHWKNKKGEVQTARAQDWVRNIKTGKAMDHHWVFPGSQFWDNEVTGQRVYEAESGDFICVSNFPSAMLDLPVKSSKENNDLMFQAFTEHIPPLGTPVTIVLTPKAEKKEPAK